MTSGITVMVPTFKRAKSLERCLQALEKQQLMPEEVIVTLRNTDDEALALLLNRHSTLNIRMIVVDQPGVLHAMQQGLNACTTDLLAITDDDAAPHEDWVRKIVDTFNADAEIAAVGGRDVLFWPNHGPRNCVVGRLNWWGGAIGNHHCGLGPAREVSYLKGVNSAYRTDVLRRIGFELPLLGSGAQSNWEVFIGLYVERLGKRIIYDPAILVDHFGEDRPTDSQRVTEKTSDPEQHVQEAHNSCIAVFPFLPARKKVLFLVYRVTVGARNAYGLAQALRFLPQQKWQSFGYLTASLRGLLSALRQSHHVFEDRPP